MEKGRRVYGGPVEKLLWMVKALLCSYGVTGILLCLISFVLYKWNVDETKIMVGIMSVYILSTFVGGILIGKFAKKRRFMWGFLVGVCYFALLLFVSYGVYHSLQNGGANVLTVFLLCVVGGTLGGMLS